MQARDKSKSIADSLGSAAKASRAQIGFLYELWLFLRANKKWWLAPVVVILLAFAILVVLGETAVAPFIYSLF